MTNFWEISPNWRASWQATADFRTDILTSRSGREQRIALRTEPRRRMTWTITCTRDRYRTLLRLIDSVGSQGGDWYFADHVVSVAIASARPAGAFSVEVASVPSWISPGKKVVLYADQRQELYTVDSISETTVVFLEEFPAVWPAHTKVLPARYGRLSSELSGEDHTNNTVEMAVTAELDPGIGVADIIDSAPVMFNGREVFTWKPNWRERVGSGFSAGRETVDYGSGRLAHYLPVAFSERNRRMVFVRKSVSEAEAMQQFFLRMKGQQGEFYMSTGADDVISMTDLVSGASTITVAGDMFAEAYSADTVHKALAVYLLDGSVIYRTVSGITVVDGNSRVTVGAPWADTIPMESVIRISWLLVWRLLSDSMTTEWLTTTVAQVALNMKTLEDLPGE